MKNKSNKGNKIDSRNNNFGYKTYYAKSESLNNNTFNTEYSPFFLFNSNFKKQYRYSKLFSYSKEKLFFLKEIKAYKDNKRRLNSNKINRFHQLCMENKIKLKSYSESPDLNELTSVNKTTTISNGNSNNFSKNKYSILKATNYTNKTRNINSFNINNLKTENNFRNKYKSSINNVRAMFNNGKYKENDSLVISSYLSNRNKIIKQDRNYLGNKRYDLKNPPSKTLNYVFNDVIGTLDNNVYCEGKLTSSRGIRKGLIEQIISKFKFNLINKIKKEFFETQFEIQQYPLSIIKEYEIFLQRNKDYYNMYLGLIKKYFGFLYAQIDEEKYKLMVLNEQREKLKEDNFQLLKKINIQNEKLQFYQNFMKLLMKIKYNTESLDILPPEYLLKFGIKGPKSKNIASNKKFIKRNSVFLITEIKERVKPQLLRKTTLNYNLKSYSRKKTNTLTEAYKVNKDYKKQKSKDNSQQKPNLFLSRKKVKDYEILPKKPIFNDLEELFERLKGIDNHLKELFKESSDKRYALQLLKMDLYKEKSRVKIDKNFKYNNYELKLLNDELIKLKEKNMLLINMREALDSTKNKNNIEYKPILMENSEKEEEIKKEKENKENKGKKEKKENKDIYSNDKKMKKINFADKLISILLNLNINIEKLINCPGIYHFLKSPKEIKINNQGKEYMKVLFCVKVVEMVFLKLMEKRRDYLSNNKMRKKYLEYEEIIERNNKIMKIYEKREEEFNQRIKREREILIKSSRVPIVPYKKDDPFSYKIYYEEFKKNEKEKLKKLRKIDKVDNIFNNFIKY